MYPREIHDAERRDERNRHGDAGDQVDRMSLRNTNTTRITRPTDRTSVNWTSWSEPRIVAVRSIMTCELDVGRNLGVELRDAGRALGRPCR